MKWVFIRRAVGRWIRKERRHGGRQPDDGLERIWLRLRRFSETVPGADKAALN